MAIIRNSRRRLLKLTGGTLLSAVLPGCYTLTKRDIFEIVFEPIRPAALAELSDVDHTFQELPIRAGDHAMNAYWDRGRNSRGILVFFNGNGYGAEIAARRILIPARALGLDLIVFNYMERGNDVPSMKEMREVVHALCDTAARLPVPAASDIYAGGHSLGCTFALEAASRATLKGAFIAAPLSTGVDMLHHQIALTRLAALRPDLDYGQLDNLALAARVRTKILVLGSQADQALPPEFTHRVFSALPLGISRRETILRGVEHSGYLASREFWEQVGGFFELPIHEPLVGYISRAQGAPR